MLTESNVPFLYRPIDRSLSQIRVLSVTPKAEGRIQCTIKHIVLDTFPPPRYRALSYTWGDSVRTHTIQVDGGCLEVRQNLYDFLSAFRARLHKFHGNKQYEEETQWLWIDQICINQAVVHERNHQVQMMADIYTKAEYVYIWLGASDERTERVMHALKSDFRVYHTTGSRKKKRRRLVTNEDTDDATHTLISEALSVSALRHFFSNPYWLRLWIVQEVMLAKWIRVMCGETLLSWEELQRFCTSGVQRLATETIEAIPTQVIWLAEHALATKSFTVADLLWTFVLNKCQEPRDKAYGFQGLLSGDSKYAVDYTKPVRTVFHDIVVVLVGQARNMPATLLGRGLHGIDYQGSVADVFSATATILSKKASDETWLRLVELILELADQMGLGLSRILSVNFKLKDFALIAIEAAWQNVIRWYIYEHALDSTQERPMKKGSFLTAVARLYRKYAHLTRILVLLLQKISPVCKMWAMLLKKIGMEFFFPRLYFGGQDCMFEIRVNREPKRPDRNPILNLASYFGLVERSIRNARKESFTNPSRIECSVVDFKLEASRFFTADSGNRYEILLAVPSSWDTGGNQDSKLPAMDIVIKMKVFVNTLRISRVRTVFWKHEDEDALFLMFKGVEPRQGSLKIIVEFADVPAEQVLSEDHIDWDLKFPFDLGLSHHRLTKPELERQATCVTYSLEKPTDPHSDEKFLGTLDPTLNRFSDYRPVLTKDFGFNVWASGAVGWQFDPSDSEVVPAHPG